MNSELADFMVVSFDGVPDTNAFQAGECDVFITQTVCDGICQAVYVGATGHADVNLMDPWQRSVMRRLLDAIEEATT